MFHSFVFIKFLWC